MLLAFNVESLPTHCRINTVGHMQGFIEAMPSLLRELRLLSQEPAAKPSAAKFDTQKNCLLCDFSNMLRNPLLDINTRGSVDADTYLKSSRFLNVLRSKKGLEIVGGLARGQRLRRCGARGLAHHRGVRLNTDRTMHAQIAGVAAARDPEVPPAFGHENRVGNAKALAASQCRRQANTTSAA